tara:strand:- start:1 stop:627 length:627 start_codon:yes stop_codon:yes gene_type:complete
MHKENYNINIACFCNKNFTNALKELKTFFGFNLILSESLKEFKNENINAVIFDNENSKKILSLNINKPKIYIQEKNKINLEKKPEVIIKLPLNILQFNQEVINVCKKFEFNNNSLISIKNYILDKNERILKKNNTSLKITEKEIDFIEILNSSTKPLSRDFILKNIWNYSTDTDTHTVETHIYRLRQKIKDKFKDSNFIKNSKKGYSL